MSAAVFVVTVIRLLLLLLLMMYVAVTGAGAASAIRIDVNCAVAWTDISCDVDFLNCVALQKEGTQLEYMY